MCQTKRRGRLGKYEDAPPYLKDNPYIHTGYRIDYDAINCVCSCVGKHNELVNIWTHMVPAAVFWVLTFVWLYRSITNSDSLVFSVFVFCVGATCCYSFSTLFHMFSGHSHRLFSWFARMDYVGILLQIMGSFLSGLHLAFFCLGSWSVLYSVGITVCVLAGLVVSMKETFQRPHYAFLRLTVFGLIVGFAIFPVCHHLMHYGLFSEEFLDRASGFLLMLVFYAVGAVFYITKFPECKFPGVFDIWLSSHQLWHVFTVLAGITHYLTVLKYINHLGQHGCAA